MGASLQVVQLHTLSNSRDKAVSTPSHVLWGNLHSTQSNDGCYSVSEESDRESDHTPQYLKGWGTGWGQPCKYTLLDEYFGLAENEVNKP